MRRGLQGYSLIEVLVTMAILVVGLLGLVGLQARAYNAETESFARAQALILAYDMADRIATNRIEAKEGTASAYYNVTDLGTGHADANCAAIAVTSAAGVAARDLCEWDLALKGATQTQGGSKLGTLSQARGCINFVQLPIPQHVVSVAWAGRGGFGTVPDDRNCGSTQITSNRRVVSVTVPFADLGD